MANVEPDTTPHDEVDEIVQPRAAPSLFGIIVRAAAQIWVVVLLLFMAAFGGVAVNQLLQKQAQLSELREAPGPNAYAVVAYRRELERQVRAYGRNWRGDSVPAPPPRPRLMEEIDLARPQERARTVTTAAAPISAPE